MGTYTATVRWSRRDAPFTDSRYSRAHDWIFDGGLTVPASASPQIVPEPQAVAANVDPEEAFVAALASCHMLFFLSLAAERGLVVDDYSDEASGILGEDDAGRLAMTEVTLRPVAHFAGRPPAPDELNELHEAAHRRCFIANSVRSRVHVEARP